MTWRKKKEDTTAVLSGRAFSEHIHDTEPETNTIDSTQISVSSQ